MGGSLTTVNMQIFSNMQMSGVDDGDESKRRRLLLLLGADCFLLPLCFHFASALLPPCFRLASALLPPCFISIS